MGDPRIAVYAGTFDPPTNGHVDIVHRAAKLYDRLIIAVSGHGRKKTVFSLEDRVTALREAVKDVPNVEVVGFTNLLYELVESFNAGVAVRGLRVTSDFDYEFQIAAMNRDLSKQFETVFLMARTQHTMISSTTVKEVASLGGDVARYVPVNVLPLIHHVYGKPHATKDKP